MGMHVVLVGSPVIGLTIYGPFQTVDDAVDWAEGECESNQDWWIVPLHATAKEEGAHHVL